MLMYTSCGWFFNELSGIETLQTMKYADHAMDLMESLGIAAPRERFLEMLAQAKSNLAAMGNGADVFRRFVPPCRVTPNRLAAHIAISRLANQVERETWVGEYHCREEELREEKNGRNALSISRVTIRNSIIGNRDEFTCAALHLGGMDYYCALQNAAAAGNFRLKDEEIWGKFHTAPLPALFRMLQEEFGRDEFGLEDILSDGRLAICEMIFGDLLQGFTGEFARLYEEYDRVVEMLQASGFEPPPQFRQLTEFTLVRRFEREIIRQQYSRDPAAYQRAIELASLMTQRGYSIDKTRANQHFSAMINEAVSKAVERLSRAFTSTALELIALARRLALEPNLEPAQERVYAAYAAAVPRAGQLARLAGALGLAHSALRRPKAAFPMPVARDGVPPTAPGGGRPAAPARRRPRRPRPPA